MYERIMVPVDGSAFSERALRPAMEIARRTGAELHIVQVHVTHTELGYPSTVAAFFDVRMDDAMRVRETEHLHSLAGRLSAAAGVRVHTALVDGAIVDRLIQYADDIDADLIVATTHGRGGLSRAVLGSVADELIRSAHVPVLAVRPGLTEDGPYEEVSIGDVARILLPLDGTDLAAAGLAPAIALARALHARCTLLRIVSPLYMLREMNGPPLRLDVDGIAMEREEATTQLEIVARALREQGIDTDYEVLTHEVPSDAILTHARQIGAGLIVMATHGRGGWRRVALGSVADSVMRAAKVPVLLVRRAPADGYGAAGRELADSAAAGVRGSASSSPS